MNGAPRTFVVDGTSSPEHFEGIKEIKITCPGNDAIDDMTLEGVMTSEETSPGYGNMAGFRSPVVDQPTQMGMFILEQTVVSVFQNRCKRRQWQLDNSVLQPI